MAHKNSKKKYYLLLHDLPGFEKKKVLLVGSSEKEIMELKGGIYTHSQSKDHFDGDIFTSIENKDKSIICSLEKFKELDQNDFELLCSIPSRFDRMEVFTSQLYKDIKKAKKGDRVTVELESNQRIVQGTIAFIGPMKKSKGSYFGIKLKEPVGDSDGYVDNISYFICDKNHGLFVPTNRIKSISEKENFLPPRQTKVSSNSLPYSAAVLKNGGQQGQQVSDAKNSKRTEKRKKDKDSKVKGSEQNYPELSPGVRVVSFEGGKNIIRGTIKYIGQLKEDNDIIEAIVQTDKKLPYQMYDAGKMPLCKKVGVKGISFDMCLIARPESLMLEEMFKAQIEEKRADDECKTMNVKQTAPDPDTSTESSLHCPTSYKESEITNVDTNHYETIISVQSEIDINIPRVNITARQSSIPSQTSDPAQGFQHQIDQHQNISLNDFNSRNHQQNHRTSLPRDTAQTTPPEYQSMDRSSSRVQQSAAGYSTLPTAPPQNTSENYNRQPRTNSFEKSASAPSEYTVPSQNTHENYHGQPRTSDFQNSAPSAPTDYIASSGNTSDNYHGQPRTNNFQNTASAPSKYTAPPGNTSENYHGQPRTSDFQNTASAAPSEYTAPPGNTSDNYHGQPRTNNFQNTASAPSKYTAPPGNTSENYHGQPRTNNFQNTASAPPAYTASPQNTHDSYHGQPRTNDFQNSAPSAYTASPQNTNGNYYEELNSNKFQNSASAPPGDNFQFTAGVGDGWKSHDQQNFDKDKREAADAKSKNLRQLSMGMMVEVNVKDEPHYGVIRFLDDVIVGERKTYIAGLELEDYGKFATNDGTFQGQRYFTCPAGKGLFVKATTCKPDRRFSDHGQVKQDLTQPTLMQEDITDRLVGYYVPPSRLGERHTGMNKGIQGHHNSCYMDSTLFAMFAFCDVFDVALHRRPRKDVLKDYGEVQRLLKEDIVNPLRRNGYVDKRNVMRLRKILETHATVGGFMNEEKDPEELVVLLFEKVLKLDEFIKLRTLDNHVNNSLLYQIFPPEIDRSEGPPSLQTLLELSLIDSGLFIDEVPSVLVLQMPRFGQQKMFERIFINPKLDLTSMLHRRRLCGMCEQPAVRMCKECARNRNFRQEGFVYLCVDCAKSMHRHTVRQKHRLVDLPAVTDGNEELKCEMELFAVVCINTSHYVSFVKCGDDWVFFDSMADRQGSDDAGYNIPEVTPLTELQSYLDGTADFKLLKKKMHDKVNEKLMRFFDDTSLCFYRNKQFIGYQ